MRRLNSLLFWILLPLAFGSPAVLAQSPTTNITEGCAAIYDAEFDYFPDKVTVEYAEGFTVEYFKNYKLVTLLSPWQGADITFEYLLLQCGTPAPEGYDEAIVVNIPVETIITTSTTILPHMKQQGVLNRLVGMDSALYTNIPEVAEGVQAGEIVEVGGGFGEMNIELVLELNPELVMLQQFSEEGSGTRERLQQSGIKAVLNADFLDTSPLGQAEWGKYVALFFNTEAIAQRSFTEVAQRYETLKALAAMQENKPTVFASSPFDGTWFMPGGQSYVAQLLADAGAEYLWADDNSAGSLFLDFESVFQRAADADYWVNLNQFWADAASALADDERYASFAAFQGGNVYNNNAIMNENGGNAYFETGVANPDVLLADLIKIFHPDLLPDHELVYYQPLR